MRKWNRIFALMLAALLLCSCGKKQAEVPAEAPDEVIVEVNGQVIHASEFEPYRQQYVSALSSGTGSSDEAGIAYLEDAALTACIQETLLHQDMLAQGCYDFDKATEEWIQQAGAAAYENALLDVAEYLRSTLGAQEGQDMTKAAQTYAAGFGVSQNTYVQVIREEYAAANYDAWLTRDCPVTDADITAAYEANTAESEARYGNDAAAFETAIANGEAAWYQPEGYRSVLQILLAAEGETDEAKLAGVAATVEEIYSRLDSGEAFLDLIAEYGTDANCKDEAFLSTGYSVHPDSILWEKAFIEAAFSEDLTEPGTWSRTPMVSDKGVHILYYLKDAVPGAAPLTPSLREALTYTIYQTRAAECLAARLETLSADAKVVYPE